MRRFKIEVAYDGTNYCGWQIQPNGITIEAVLNRTLSEFLGEDIHVIGASRTDSGVHAYGNVAVFDSETTIPPEKLCLALNPHLPEDIRLVSSAQVADDFHPRRCPTRKTYEYHIQNGRISLPTKRLYAYLVTAPLDVAAMQEAGQYLVGTHDFKSFCAAKTQAQTTVRTVTGISVFVKEELPSFSVGVEENTHTDKMRPAREIVIRVEGEGFLYNMVRIISGTLLKVGLGVYPPAHVAEILAACDRSKAGETVPAKGLFLKEIKYV